jgi:hypothetical protein
MSEIRDEMVICGVGGGVFAKFFTLMPSTLRFHHESRPGLLCAHQFCAIYPQRRWLSRVNDDLVAGCSYLYTYNRCKCLYSINPLRMKLLCGTRVLISARRSSSIYGDSVLREKRATLLPRALAKSTHKAMNQVSCLVYSAGGSVLPCL